jgi:hypothetical protein
MNKFRQFACWSFATNVFASIESIMSSHSMLNVVAKADTEVLMTVNYMAKDILGQLGGIIYISKMGSAFDKYPRTIANHAMTAQQTAIVIECLTPLLPLTYFIPVAGVANMVKNISFTGFGGVNTKILSQLANKDLGIGELYSKLTIVNTVASTIGMICGLGLIAKVPDDTVRMSLMPFIIGARIFTFNRAIKGLI